MIAHAATILLAAFLLFLVQPLVGRYVLPLYGGTAAVWTIALLFFQSALLLGYGYAYGLMRIARPRVQAGVHAVLVLGAIATLPVIPPAGFEPGSQPTLEILWLLLRTVGLPFVLLAATSPLLQAWLAGETFAPKVYRLYALSNVGSLVALLAYPFALEPWVGRDAQAWAWSGGYLAFALATLLVAVRRWFKPATPPAEQPGEAPGLARRAVWVGLAACGVWMLMGVTNRMSINIAPTPFLWVLPLSAYLFSFVLTFASARWYRRKLMVPLLIGAFVAFSVASSTSLDYPIALRIALFAAALLVTCVVLHAELYRLRPGPARLTGFYLSVAGGGALGGVLVGVVAPHVFPMYWEFELGQVLCLLAVLCALAVDRSSRLYRFRPWYAWLAIALGMAFWGDVQVRTLENQLELTVDSRRSFYGVSRIVEDDGMRALIHGTTNHGAQFLDDRRDRPATYYGPNSGVNKLLRGWPSPKRVGVVGLGIGTLAAFGNAGDHFRFYELDPDVEQLAREHFTFLSHTRADVSVAIGDGRLVLDREAAQHYDVLVLDAFSSDAVPVHLLTLEAFEIYRHHMAPGGVIAVNVTNHHLDLQPVVTAAARHNGWHWKYLEGREDGSSGQMYSEWMLLATDRAATDHLPPGPLDPPARDMPAWTDDFSNLFRILR